MTPSVLSLPRSVQRWSRTFGYDQDEDAKVSIFHSPRTSASLELSSNKRFQPCIWQLSILQPYRDCSQTLPADLCIVGPLCNFDIGGETAIGRGRGFRPTRNFRVLQLVEMTCATDNRLVVTFHNTTQEISWHGDLTRFLSLWGLRCRHLCDRRGWSTTGSAVPLQNRERGITHKRNYEPARHANARLVW